MSALEPVKVKPDPKRPWKALAAALVAGIAAAMAQGQDVIPAWGMLALAAVGAGLATYLVPNPPS